MTQHKHDKKAYILAVDMGYGHQRASYPLKDISEGEILSANNYPGIDPKERDSWNKGRKLYEIISYFKKVPVFGKLVFSAMDYFQKIDRFYPKRDLSKQSFQQKHFVKRIKKGTGKGLIERLNKNPLPLITTFFVSAYFAEYYNYKGNIYCVVCDADVSRAWAPVNPATSRIKYLAPNKRVKERLELYGVNPKNIFISGFPLPKENIGGRQKKILRKDLKNRIFKLDPQGVYRKKYAKLIEDYLCPISEFEDPKRPLTITFAVGGAGAQRDLGAQIVKGLKKELTEDKIKLNLVAGSRGDVYDFFTDTIKKYSENVRKNVEIIYHPDKMEYFRLFNEALRITDILWTKPSELTFYSGLGIPVIMSSPIGSQEHYNREWLLAIGAGINSKNPKYVNEWLFDWLDSGWLAEAAMQGFLDAPSLGTYNIEDTVLYNKVQEIDSLHLL